MTKYEALKILGLNNNFTEEELKKVYRKLVIKYHPDKYPEDSFEQKQANEALKKINEAKEFLDKIIKKNNKQNNAKNNHLDIAEYKRKKTEELDSYISSNIFIISMTELINYHRCIFTIINDFEKKIQNYSDKNKIDQAYLDSKKRIIDVFNVLKTNFFNRNNIDETEIKETINYDCSLEKFYDQLLKLNKIYNKADIYYKKIKEDLHEYELRIGYSALKTVINLLIEEVLKILKQNNYSNYDQLLNYLKDEIDKKFVNYFDILSDIKDLLDFLDNCSTDYSNISEITEYRNKIAILYKKLQKDMSHEVIEELKDIVPILNEFKKMKKFKKNQHIINEYSKLVINNYQKKLQSFTYPQDFVKIEIATKIFNEVLELINKVKNGEISIDDFKQLTNLKFTNYEQDKAIINKVKGIDNSKGIFIRNSRFNSFNDIALGKIIYQDENSVTIQGISLLNFDELSIKTIYKTEFDNMYIQLETFLRNSKFCGRYDKDFSEYIVLYYNNILSLIYIPKINSIKINSKSINLGGFSSESISFKDINYVVDYIDNYLKKKELNDEKVKKRGKIY